MTRKAITYALFPVGVFFLEVHTTFAVLWQLIMGSSESYPLSGTTFLYYAQGFTPILGVLILLFAGLIYEKMEIKK